MTTLRIRHILGLAAAVACAAGPGHAIDLRWPEGATLASADTPRRDTFDIATGPFQGGTVPLRPVDGIVSEQIWHIEGAARDPLVLLEVLRTQLQETGFTVDFTCADRACGGFDFRHAVPIAVGADMFVDLSDFHYLAASRPEDGDGDATHVALTVSAGGRTGFAHLAVVAPPGDLPPGIVPSTRDILEVAVDPSDDAPPTLSQSLEAQGWALLEDLSFGVGASALSGGPYDSLTALAAYLDANPDTRVVLVGHTDAQGGLTANIDLSRARAQSVRRFLIDDLGVDPDRIDAQGIGFLAPRASNATPQGRDANRRVEVVIATLPE